jgi:hypothetical protein
MASLNLNTQRLMDCYIPTLKFEEKEKLADLGKYGLLRLKYLHEQKPEIYS